MLGLKGAHRCGLGDMRSGVSSRRIESLMGVFMCCDGLQRRQSDGKGAGISIFWC